MRWLNEPNSRNSFAIETTPKDATKPDVRLLLFSVSTVPNQNEPESACWVKFTLVGDAIVEKELEANCAG